MEAAVAALEERLGYRFVDSSLLQQALRHRSWCAENPGHESNERLEFLGDAVLDWVVSDLVYRTHAESREGKLSNLRKSVVNGAALAQLAEQLELGPCLALGVGTRQEGSRSRVSLLADALEAVIAAVYLDGGADAAYRLVERHVAPMLERAEQSPLDSKSSLLELARRELGVEPVYEVTDVGPAHAKEFTAVVSVGGEVLGTGIGPTRKEAQRRASTEALLALRGPQSPETAGA